MAYHLTNEEATARIQRAVGRKLIYRLRYLRQYNRKRLARERGRAAA